MPHPRATFHLGLPPKLKEVRGDHISRPSRLWEGLCYSGACSLSLPLSQPCCKAAAVQMRCPKCREEPCHHLSKGFIFFFWKLATRQHAHTALFTYPEKALSAGCLAVRRSRIKSEGFKGRASLSNYSLETRGCHRPWAWPWIFPKKWTNCDVWFFSCFFFAASCETWTLILVPTVEWH